MLKSSLCNYSDAYILVKGTILIAAQEGDNGDNPNNRGREVVFQNFAPLLITYKKQTIHIYIYNIKEYSDNYSKSPDSLWQYYKDETALIDVGAISNFSASKNNSIPLKSKQKVIGETADGGTKDVEIMVLLKYLSNFWRTLEITLINCEINCILTWSDKCVLSNDTKVTTFAITDTTLYFPVVTLSTQDNAKLLQQLINQVLKEQLTGKNINLK